MQDTRKHGRNIRKSGQGGDFFSLIRRAKRAMWKLLEAPCMHFKCWLGLCCLYMWMQTFFQSLSVSILLNSYTYYMTDLMIYFYIFIDILSPKASFFFFLFFWSSYMRVLVQNGGSCWVSNMFQGVQNDWRLLNLGCANDCS